MLVGVAESVRDLGEFGLIARLVGRLGLDAPGVLVGPGDDCAMVHVGGSHVLATADMLIEGVHFDRSWSSAADVGFKAIACNVSDVAAMGGHPLFALISLGAPASSPVDLLDAMYAGVAEAATRFGVGIVGGDTVGAEALTIAVTVLGEPTSAGPVLRSGAQPGDALCVTGALGAAAAGLFLLRDHRGEAHAGELLDSFPGLAETHRRGNARVAEGIAAAHAGAHAMIDISDGLLQDVGHLCAASGVGAALRSTEVPVAPGVLEAERVLGRTGLALRGGDDYELAIALPTSSVEALRAAIHPTPLSVVGVFTDDAGVRLDGAPTEASAGWDHFQNPP